jgi:multidrug efflux pump subunit AcrA (membrane-fusion protein)
MEQLMVNALPISSLDQVISDDGMELGDVIATYDQTPEEREEQAEQQREAQQLRELIRVLPGRDQALLNLAWGLEGLPLERAELAAKAGMSVRAMDARLRQLQGQLRSMAVQLVMVTVPLVPCVKAPRQKRLQRPLSAVHQLSLALVIPLPSGGVQRKAGRGARCRTAA